MPQRGSDNAWGRNILADEGLLPDAEKLVRTMARANEYGSSDPRASRSRPGLSRPGKTSGEWVGDGRSPGRMQHRSRRSLQIRGSPQTTPACGRDELRRRSAMHGDDRGESRSAEPSSERGHCWRHQMRPASIPCARRLRREACARVERAAVEPRQKAAPSPRARNAAVETIARPSRMRAAISGEKRPRYIRCGVTTRPIGGRSEGHGDDRVGRASSSAGRGPVFPGGLRSMSSAIRRRGDDSEAAGEAGGESAAASHATAAGRASPRCDGNEKGRPRCERCAPDRISPNSGHRHRDRSARAIANSESHSRRVRKLHRQHCGGAGQASRAAAPVGPRDRPPPHSSSGGVRR